MRVPEYKILSIDGGGIRGIIPCAILKFIEDNTNCSIDRLFNLIAGTSTGGIISLGLTMRGQHKRNAYSAADMLNLYMKNGSIIFHRPNNILNFIPEQLLNKAYDVSGLETLLQQYFGESMLKDALTNVLITTYDIESGRPFYYRTRLAKINDKDNHPIKIIARSTSSAPTFFQPSVIQGIESEDLAFVDGGVYANNPSILAYGEAKELWKEKVRAESIIPTKVTKNFEPVVMPYDDDLPFYLLSIGAGYAKRPISGLQAGKFRKWKWIKPMLTNVFMNAVAESTHYTMQYLLPPYSDNSKRYHRIDFEIPEAISTMDNASLENMQRLLDAAENYIKANKGYLEEICNIIS
jgi:predicted acylesterase/phospholipase RssA